MIIAKGKVLQSTSLPSALSHADLGNNMSIDLVSKDFVFERNSLGSNWKSEEPSSLQPAFVQSPHVQEG